MPPARPISMYSRTSVASTRRVRSERATALISSRSTETANSIAGGRPGPGAAQGQRAGPMVCGQSARSTRRSARASDSAAVATQARAVSHRVGTPSAHQDLAVHDGPSARRSAASRRPGWRTDRGGRLMRLAASHQDQVGTEAGRRPARSPAARPNAAAPPRVAIASTSRAGSAPGPAAHGLQRRRQPHLLEHVELVVARRAVGAERHATRRARASRRPARCRIRASGSSRGSAAP